MKDARRLAGFSGGTKEGEKFGGDRLAVSISHGHYGDFQRVGWRMAITFTETEREIIILKAIWEMIAEMVNYEIFAKFTKTTDMNLTFNTMTHQRIFNVLLVDLLSQPRKWPFGLSSSPQGTLKSEQCIMFHLKRICDEPILNPMGANALRSPLTEFLEWLEADCTIKEVWLPSIGLKIDIRVKRVIFIKICGNIAKHNFTRLNADVREICAILAANGTTIDPDQGYLIIPEFYEWFHAHVFGYHSSAIAEFLNNIRWGIYDYLWPEFARSFTKNPPPPERYRYKFPTDCHSPVA